MSSCIKNSSTSNPKRRKRVLLGITGSVAAIKGPELALLLSKELDAHVVVLLTHGGSNFWYKAKDYNPQIWEEYETFQGFGGRGDGDGNGDGNGNGHAREDVKNGEDFDRDSLPSLPDDDEAKGRSIVLFTAQDEWKGWQKMKDPVLHIQLRDWADIAVIAPLSAHTLAKIATGLCDDTLTCVLRAWDFGYKNSLKKGKPIVLAPACNTAMWEHPLTQSQLDIVVKFGISNGQSESSLVKIVNPQVKTLACGEVGNGALANTVDIAKAAKDSMSE